MIIIHSIIIVALNSFYLSSKVTDNINHSALASVSKTVIMLLNFIVINVIFLKNC